MESFTPAEQSAMMRLFPKLSARAIFTPFCQTRNVNNGGQCVRELNLNN